MNNKRSKEWWTSLLKLLRFLNANKTHLLEFNKNRLQKMPYLIWWKSNKKERLTSHNQLKIWNLKWLISYGNKYDFLCLFWFFFYFESILQLIFRSNIILLTWEYSDMNHSIMRSNRCHNSINNFFAAEMKKKII